MKIMYSLFDRQPCLKSSLQQREKDLPPYLVWHGKMLEHSKMSERSLLWLFWETHVALTLRPIPVEAWIYSSFWNFSTLCPYEWPQCNFSLQHHARVSHKGREIKGNDHQLKNLLILKQILLVSPLGNVKRAEWRIYILMLGCKGLNFR